MLDRHDSLRREVHMETSFGRSRTAPAAAHPRTIVVGVDPTGSSRGAEFWAAEEADQTRSPIRFVTAFRPFDGPSEPGPAATLPEPLWLDTDAWRVPGDPTDVLVEQAGDAALLVVGRRDTSRLAHTPVGSTSFAVAGRCTVPVVVVPQRWVQAPRSSAPIVVGVAGPDLPSASGLADSTDEDVLAFACARAARLRVPLIVVSAWAIPALLAWSPGDSTRCRTDNERALERLLEPWRAEYPETEIVAHCVAETSKQALLDAVEVAQLTVVGRHTARHNGGFSFGATARGVVHHATHPVAVVPVTPPRDLVAGG
jgi:nucleotide-binding universal stress UspA family protein